MEMTTALNETETIGSETHMAQSAVSDVIRVVVGFLQRMNGWRHRRRLEAQVRAMSYHQLRDIGIHRPDIGFITLGQATTSSTSEGKLLSSRTLPSSSMMHKARLRIPTSKAA